MTLFLSTFINQMDAKGRVSVPASFREQAGLVKTGRVILYRSFTHPCIEGCDMDRMALLSNAADQMPSFSKEQDSLMSLVFADARPLNIDGTGRIILPEDLQSHAKLGKKLAFVGRGKTFQIWDPVLFEKNQQALREDAMKEAPSIVLGS